MTSGVPRRTFLTPAVAGAGVAACPAVLRAQAKTIKVGVISPVTGALAEVGQDCRLGAQMAAEAINAAGGIAAQGGGRRELLVADSQTKPHVAPAQGDPPTTGGAEMVTRAPSSAHVARRGS